MRLRQGDFDDETVYADDPLEAARSFVEAGARFLHVVDLDGAREGEPRNLAPPRADRGRARRAGAVRRRPALARVDARARSTAGAARVVLGTAAYTDPDLLDEALTRVHLAHPGGESTCAAARCRWPAGRARRRCAARTRSAACSGAAPRASSTRTSTATGCSRGPTSTRSSASRQAVRGALPLLGRHRLARRPAGAARAAAGEPGRRDLGQGALRGPVHGARGQAALEGRLMLLRRVIPCLDVDKGRVVKGVEFVNIRDAGDPVELAVALPGRGRRRDRLPRHHRLAREARDGRSSWRAAAPTTCSSRSRSAAACARSRTPRPCSTPAPTRCRSTRRRWPARSCSASWPRCSAPSAWCWPSTPRREGRRLRRVRRTAAARPVGRDAVEWAREGVERGAGEILLTSMDRDGTEDGYELELTRAVADAVDVPVIASGGAGAPRPPRRRGRARAAPTRCCAPRSSTTGSTACARPRSACAPPGSRCACRVSGRSLNIGHRKNGRRAA